MQRLYRFAKRYIARWRENGRRPRGAEVRPIWLACRYQDIHYWLSN